MRRHRGAALLLAVLLGLAAFHGAVAWQDMATLARNGFLYDDGFYAFKIAQNIASGNGFTFDGDHPTTGFQPLYVFLLVPAFLVSGGDLVLPVHLALTLLAVFTVLTALLIYRLARRYVGEALAIVAAILWGFSPIVIKQTANGLETAISTFMVAASVLYYLERVRGVPAPSARRFLALGLLLGLAVLARIDALILVLVVLLDYLLVMRRNAVPARRLSRLAIVPAGVLLLYGPWMLFNIAQMGSPLQDSGAATRFLSLAYASYFGYGREGLAAKGPDASFIWSHLEHSISTLKVLPPAHPVFRLLEKIGVAANAATALRILANVLGLAALAAFGAAIVRWRRDPARAARRELDFLLLFGALLVASYSLYIFGMFFFIRYYYPLYLVGCVYFAFILADALAWYGRRSTIVRRALVPVAAAYLIGFGWFAYSQAFRSHPLYPYYDIAQWVKETTAPDARIGIFQCGTIGYLADRHVCNLDGKVNREALVAMREGSIESYCRSEGVDLIVDHRRIIEIFLGYDPQSRTDLCTTVPPGLMRHPTGWIAYRVPPDASLDGSPQ